MKLLMIEDNKSVSEMMAMFFKKEKWDAHFAYDGNEAVEMFNEDVDGWDMVTLDLNLPGKDGMQVSADIRKASPTVPIIMLTARDSESDQVLGLEMGADDYVTKPEWHGNMYWIGSASVIVLIAGAVLTSLTDKTDPNRSASENWGVGIRALILSTIGYAGYTIVVHYGNVNAQAVVMPQAVGMLLGALIWSFKDKPWVVKATYRNIVTGLVWSIGNLFMFMAMAQIGQAVAYSLSQMGIVISTFGSIYLLGEHKTKREMVYVVIGSILVIVGGVALSLMKA